MYSLIFLALTCLVSFCQAWQLFQLFPKAEQQELNGLEYYSVNLMNFSSQEKVLIFGGVLDGRAQNSIAQSDINTEDGTVNSIPGDSPVGRYKHCSATDRYKLYIYGGLDDNGTILTDLWEFNSIFMSWTLIDSSGPTLNDCSMVFSGSYLIISGTKERVLSLWRFSIYSNAWLAVPYSYLYANQETGSLWDKTIATVIVGIQGLQNNVGTVLQSNELKLDRSCTAMGPNGLFIVTQTDIYSMDLVTFKIRHLKMIQKTFENFTCEVSSDWLFIVDQTQDGDILLWYHSLEQFTVEGLQYLTNPGGSFASFETMMINEDLWLFANMRAWILPRSCTPVGFVEACFYGLKVCAKGMTGEDCSIPACPNSLILFDEQNFGSVVYVCSNHGTCQQDGCHCEDYWGGEDCSTYLRQACYGNLMQNWPVMNCECEEETSGGNNCQVTFCYNDCSEHGVCQGDGNCRCESGYYGADCSIAIIEFPSAISIIE